MPSLSSDASHTQRVCLEADKLGPRSTLHARWQWLHLHGRRLLHLHDRRLCLLNLLDHGDAGVLLLNSRSVPSFVARVWSTRKASESGWTKNHYLQALKCWRRHTHAEGNDHEERQDEPRDPDAQGREDSQSEDD